MIAAHPHRRTLLAWLALAVWPAVVLANTADANRAAIELAGVRVATASDDSPGLPLRGAGLLRVGLFFDVYVAALYADPSKPAEALLSLGQPKELVIHYLRDIERQDIIRAAERHLEQNLGAAERERIAPALARWHAAMRGVRAGDRYIMRYTDGRLGLRLNEEPLIELEAPELARAYFGIWLDENSLAPGLRRELLGLAENG